MLVFPLFPLFSASYPLPLVIQPLILNPPGSSSEMAIFCDSALDWILKCTSDPDGVSVLRVMGERMSTKFDFSDKHLSWMNFCSRKDRPRWPLPDAELAGTYIDGMLPYVLNSPKEQKKKTREGYVMTDFVGVVDI
jgi:hypothetical protein